MCHAPIAPTLACAQLAYKNLFTRPREGTKHVLPTPQKAPARPTQPVGEGLA